MKKLILSAVVVISTGLGYAEDPSERGVPTSPLTIYSAGLGAGAVVSINNELRRDSEQFLKVSFINTVHFRDHLGLFLDFNWFAPGLNFGADMGFDFLLTSSDFRPFIGVGVGAHYFDKSDDFGENIGPSLTVHAGFVLDITDALQVRLRIPYHVVANEARDHAAGLEVGFLFSDRFRKVKKLDYTKM